MNISQKIIFHFDLDAFYATVEENLNPSLKKQPVIVVGRHHKSVVSCANYEARKYGIKSAMPVSEAIQKCNFLKLVNLNFNEYVKASESFKKFLIQNVSSYVEEFSIDECFVDVSHLIKDFNEAIKFAKKVQNLVYDKLSLSVSIGISNNKFLSKMATDMNKPNGVTLLLQKDVESKVWPLPIDKMLWIGESTQIKLNSLGIKTIGDLANWKKIDLLKPIFGKNLNNFIKHANGYGDDFIDNTKNNPKSFSISKTLFDDIDNYEELKLETINICKELYEKLWTEQITGKTIIVGLKSADWKYETKSNTMQHYFLSENELIQQALSLLSKLFKDFSIRLISVGIQNLRNINNIKIQNSLFQNDISKNWLPPSNAKKNIFFDKNNELLKIANEINREFGKAILNIGSKSFVKKTKK